MRFVSRPVKCRIFRSSVVSSALLCVRVDERLAHLVDDGRRALALELCEEAQSKKKGGGGQSNQVSTQAENIVPSQAGRQKLGEGGLEEGGWGTH